MIVKAGRRQNTSAALPAIAPSPARHTYLTGPIQPGETWFGGTFHSKPFHNSVYNACRSDGFE